jgi:hypothetical protein
MQPQVQFQPSVKIDERFLPHFVAFAFATMLFCFSAAESEALQLGSPLVALIALWAGAVIERHLEYPFALISRIDGLITYARWLVVGILGCCGLALVLATAQVLSLIWSRVIVF